MSLDASDDFSSERSSLKALCLALKAAVSQTVVFLDGGRQVQRFSKPWSAEGDGLQDRRFEGIARSSSPYNSSESLPACLPVKQALIAEFQPTADSLFENGVMSSLDDKWKALGYEIHRGEEVACLIVRRDRVASVGKIRVRHDRAKDYAGKRRRRSRWAGQNNCRKSRACRLFSCGDSDARRADRRPVGNSTPANGRHRQTWRLTRLKLSSQRRVKIGRRHQIFQFVFPKSFAVIYPCLLQVVFDKGTLR